MCLQLAVLLGPDAVAAEVVLLLYLVKHEAKHLVVGQAVEGDAAVTAVESNPLHLTVFAVAHAKQYVQVVLDFGPGNILEFTIMVVHVVLA